MLWNFCFQERENVFKRGTQAPAVPQEVQVTRLLGVPAPRPLHPVKEPSPAKEPSAITRLNLAQEQQLRRQEILHVSRALRVLRGNCKMCPVVDNFPSSTLHCMTITM